MTTGSGTGTAITESSDSLWITPADATTFFSTRHGVGALWSSLTDAQKTALLTTAQADIKTAGRFSFVDDDGEALDVSQAMKDAVCEQALFRLLDPDVDLRAAIQAQGVIETKEAGEKFSEALLLHVPLCGKAIGLLNSYKVALNSGGFEVSK